jgi:hypothetical protein
VWPGVWMTSTSGRRRRRMRVGSRAGRGVGENGLFEIAFGATISTPALLSQHVAAGDIIGLTVGLEGFGDGAALVFGEIEVKLDVFGRVEDHHLRPADQAVAAGSLAGTPELVELIASPSAPTRIGASRLPQALMPTFMWATS